VGLGAWALSGDDGSEGRTPGGDTTGSQSQPAKPSVAKLNVENVTAAEETRNGRHDEAIGERLGVVTDGRAGGGEWETQTYHDVNFGNLAKGLGVMLDMGRPVQVSSVKVNVPEGGGTLQVKIGDSQSPGALPHAGRAVTTAGETTINARGTGRYVLVWFTKLPPTHKGKISEITVLGTARG
jgi:hypothetical protein